MTTVSIRLPQILRSLEKAPVRFLADEQSGCVFVERTDDQHTLSSEVVQRFADVLRVTAPKRVLLLDFKDQLTGVHEVKQLTTFGPSLFSAIHALCFSSALHSQLLRTSRRRQIDRNIWEVTVSWLSVVNEPAQDSIELKELLGLLERFSKDASVLTKTATQTERLPKQSTAREEEDDQGGQSPHLSAVERRIALRNQLRQEVALITVDKWKEWSGASGKNPSAALGKHKREGRLFAVLDNDRDFYPMFQFSEDAKPKPAIAQVLERVPEAARGWPLLSWFNAGNVFLKDQKPMDVIDSDPKAVADAAARFFDSDD